MTDIPKPVGRALAGLGDRSRAVVLVLCALVLLAILVAAIFGSSIAPYDPTAQNLLGRLLPPGSTSSMGYHLLGTDSLGRDMTSLIIAGARPAVGISLAAVVLAIVVGLFLGLVAGYRGGAPAEGLFFLTNVQLAFPFFLLAITIVAIVQPSVPVVVMVVSLGIWVQFARLSMSETMRLKGLEFIEAIRVMRGGTARILTRHLLPNILPHIIVLATFAFGAAIMTESGLSFVGLGVPTDSPTWGRMISVGRDYVATSWWLTTIPGLAIFALVLSVNVLGEELRERVDPRSAASRPRRRVRPTPSSPSAPTITKEAK
jgi:peptide/nickel transport system permease protein